VKTKAIYPGTFDPITYGHIDIIKRACNLFDEVIVAVAENTGKKPTFGFNQRIDTVKQSLTEFENVSVCGFSKLLIDFAKQKKANIIVRGLRAVSDFEYEFQLAGMNRKLNAQIETVFLTPDESLMLLSSTLVREIALLGGDISSFVPPHVEKALLSNKKG
jgi:pantetheine-phosphate adenylyltransferase